MDQTLLGWLTSLSSLLVLALLLHLWQRPERWGPRLGAGLLILLCLLGFHWIFISLHRYGEMPAAAAAIATFLLALYVAGYGLLAGWLIRRHRLSPLSIAGLIALLEWLRTGRLQHASVVGDDSGSTLVLAEEDWADLRANGYGE